MLLRAQVTSAEDGPMAPELPFAIGPPPRLGQSARAIGQRRATVMALKMVRRIGMGRQGIDSALVDAA
jgi:hypothetical protein